jgi:hypothetical protein
MAGILQACGGLWVRHEHRLRSTGEIPPADCSPPVANKPSGLSHGTTIQGTTEAATDEIKQQMHSPTTAHLPNDLVQGHARVTPSPHGKP